MHIQNQPLNKNYFIPNIMSVTNNIPEPMDPLDNQDMAIEILNIFIELSLHEEII